MPNVMHLNCPRYVGGSCRICDGAEKMAGLLPSRDLVGECVRAEVERELATREQVLRAALIELGWTPPGEVPKFDEARERERFETYMKSYGCTDFRRNQAGYYMERMVGSRWLTWKTATGGGR